MRTLLIACGNPLRGDDGVAAEVLRLITPAASLELRTVHQLSPELSEEISRFERVVFVDADTMSPALTLEPVNGMAPRSPLTHSSNPDEIVSLSRALFGFTGDALICRIPAHDFSGGETLSPRQHRLAAQVARELELLL